MNNSFAAYKWRYRYCTSALNPEGNPTDVLHEFYIPALSRAVRYDRVAGYFRSTSLAAASQGYTAFIGNGGMMRLIVGADLATQDVSVILRGNHKHLSARLLAALDDPDKWPSDVKNGVALLGAMVAAKQMEVRVALRVNPVTHEAIPADSCEDGYVHEKWFIMTDSEGRRLYGSGSLNESKTALIINAENIDIHCDWESPGDLERVNSAEADFARLWNGQNPHMKVLPIPEAVKQRLIRLKTLSGRMAEIDGTVLPTNEEMTPKERLRFAVLCHAPQMPGGEFIGMYSAPVSPWPHQEVVSRRLIESWPYSYLLCDEVGLGKTIETALAIRSLVLARRVKRVLIIAPASLTGQWHRELAHKAMLPFALSQPKAGSNGKFLHSYLLPEEKSETDGNLYAPDLNIVSSGLVRRKERLRALMDAANFDIVLLDEAHYARRQNPRNGTDSYPKYGELYKVLQGIIRKKAKALWLATATPMQIDPIEAYDLFRLTQRVGQFQSDPTLTKEYFLGLGKIVQKEQPSRQRWAMMGQSFLQIEKIDPYLWNVLQETAVKSKNRKVLFNLPIEDPHNADLKNLAQPLFASSPLSRVMMRHTRALLEIYREQGKLNSNLARRHVRPVCAIAFTPAEKKFYAMLEEYCRGLDEQVRTYSPDAKQVMRFLLSFLQLRFASSSFAIQQTLERRLRRVKYTLKIGGSVESEEELQERIDAIRNEDEDYDEDDLDDITMDALLKDRSQQDLEWEEDRIGAMLKELASIHETPSKIQTLLGELEERKLPDGRLRQTVLFTRFFDTLRSIRGYLRTLDESMRVGIYAGGGKAFWFDPAIQEDVSTSHEEIKAKFLSGEIDLLLCTDAAAEGLNLQTADLLINYDMGWNPMKIEQRIGRIDRIGQKYDDIEVVNMCYVGSTEEVVYGRLVDRLREANLIVGAQQISLLPVTQEEFRQLQFGETTAAQLEATCMERLEEQRKATASMEMSAKDIYEMYSRMGERMQQRQFPATTDDLWNALTTSEWLQERGARLDEDGTWSLPASSSWSSVRTAAHRDESLADAPYVSWGHPALGTLLSVLGGELDDVPYLKKISLYEDDTMTAFAVSTADGAELVTNYAQIDEIAIDENRPLSEEDVERCKKQLTDMASAGSERREKLLSAEQKNVDIAKLHSHFICGIAIELLRKMMDNGVLKIKEAISQLEENQDKGYHAYLPLKPFEGKDTELLFVAHESAGKFYTHVNGILLACVVSLIKRTADGARGRMSEKTTEDIIRRIERMDAEM